MRRALLTLAFALIASPVGAQWTNRYPLLDGYRHHVYLEGYELPTMNVGPTDPAVSPDGTRVAFSARGWIWMLDLASGRARRITDGAAMDFRPAWSADGTRVAFVRDDSRDTRVVVRDLTDGTERVVDTDAIDMDPVFAVDGTLVYVSASGGAFDLWSDDGRKLTDRPGLVVSPSLSADGGTLVYLHKRDGDRIVARDRATAGELVLATGRILSQTRPAVSPDGRLVAYNVPTQDGYELRLVSTTDPGTTVRLTTGLRGLPLSPAWSPDGAWVWYTEADADEVMRLYRVPAVGGRPEEVFVRAWDWGADVGVLRVTTRRAATRRAASGGALEGSSPVPTAARLAVVDGSGHPAVPGSTQPRVGGQDGRVFFYSPGVVDVVVPVGEARVSAVRGLATPEVSATVSVRAGRTSEVTLDFEPVWDRAGSAVTSIPSRIATPSHRRAPVLLAVDGILGTMDWLEVACLWSDEIGTAEMWYRFLNLGVPVALEAGTDVMTDFYRTMAVGTTRLYVQTGGGESFDAYWESFRAGRSFVTTGPMLLFDIDGVTHGATVAGGRAVPFTVRLATAVPVDTVELLLNGDVIWSSEGRADAGERSYRGRIDLPRGGWIAVRARGGGPTWPSMDSYAFAQTSPVWIDHVGSTDPEAARRAAADLGPILDAAEERLRQAYGETPTPNIDERFRAARARLEAWR